MIKLSIILYPIALFIIILILHILIWRIRRPQKQIIIIFLIFIIIPIFAILAFFFLYPKVRINLISIEDLFLMLLFYIALAGVYIQTYPAIQAESPSLFIVNLIGKNKKPMDKKEILKRIQKDNFINERMLDLEAEGLIKRRKSDGNITITKKGLILSEIFIFYRKFIGLKEGKG